MGTLELRGDSDGGMAVGGDSDDAVWIRDGRDAYAWGGEGGKHAGPGNLRQCRNDAMTKAVGECGWVCERFVGMYVAVTWGLLMQSPCALDRLIVVH